MSAELLYMGEHYIALLQSVRDLYDSDPYTLIHTIHNVVTQLGLYAFAMKYD